MAELEKLLCTDSKVESLKKINAIIENGGSNINDKITNCLLEVPQRIKLELNNGTLTLKAGSEVIVPNGKNADGSLKFDYVTIESDITYGETFTSSVACYATYSQTRKAIEILSQNDTNFSYDSIINKVVHSDLSGHNLSFPIALVHRDTTGIGSLDQVFNGMGYIGSTIWVDKGVKCLIPNGRNKDGTLKNIEYTVESLRTVSQTASNSNLRRLFISIDGWSAVFNYNYFEGKDGEQPTTTASAARIYYAYDTNIVYLSLANTTTWEKRNFAQLCELTCSTTALLTLSPKTTFRAVDYNDLTSIVPTGTVISSASSATPIGYLYCNGATVSRTTYADLFSAIGTTYGTGDGSTTFNLPNYTGYRFVTNTTVSVKGTGIALGLTDGSLYGGISNNSTDLIYASTANYGKAVGTAQANGDMGDKKVMGLTTDASKSGITGTVSTATIKWYIKY